MNTNNISFESLVSQLVTVFKSAKMSADYNSEAVQHEIFSGWTGGRMSPISRPAYLQEFGKETVEAAEKMARKQIDEEKAEFEHGEYFAASLEADKVTESGEPGELGGYVWAVSDGLKCECGVPGAIHDLNGSDSEYISRDLCKIERVEQVSDSFFADQLAADQLVKRVGADSFPGGFIDYQTPDGRRYVTSVCLCISESGKYCYIDAEGFNYARYILFPVNYLTVFAAEFAAEKAKKEAAEEKKRQEEERAAAARKADYLARCAKWSGLMEPVAKYEAAEQAASWRTPEGKKAKRKLQSVRRSNILAMFKAACPGVKVSIRKNDGWGDDWFLTYQDGPTLERLQEITDFSLFQRTRDVYRSHEDYWDTETLEFVEFSQKYMGSFGGNGIELCREMTDETKAGILAKVCEVVPGVADRPLTAEGRDVEAYSFTRSDLDALREKFGLSLDQVCGNVCGWSRIDWNNGADMWVSTLISNIFDASDFSPVADKGGSSSTPSTANNEAAAGEAGAPDGFELQEIPGGVAVVGDSRTTYRHRKEIKAKGCAWNYEAKRWEATTAEAVATVKTWFGVSDAVENLEEPTTGETAAEAAAAVIEGVEQVQEAGTEDMEHIQTIAAAAVPSVKTEAIPHYSVSELLEVSPDPSFDMSDFLLWNNGRYEKDRFLSPAYLDKKKKEEFEICLTLSKEIEISRVELGIIPQTGDAIVYCDETGTYNNAVVVCEPIEPDFIIVVDSPRVHITHEGKIKVSGGGWHRIDRKKLKRQGKAKRFFWTWGRNGWGVHEDVHFWANVNNWIIVDD